MSIEQTMADLLNRGVGPLVFGKPPQNPQAPRNNIPEFFVTGDLNIATGGVGDQLQTKPQAVGDTIHDALNKYVALVEKIEKMEVKPEQPKILIPPSNGRIPKLR